MSSKGPGFAPNANQPVNFFSAGRTNRADEPWGDKRPDATTAHRPIRKETATIAVIASSNSDAFARDAAALLRNAGFTIRPVFCSQFGNIETTTKEVATAIGGAHLVVIGYDDIWKLETAGPTMVAAVMKSVVASGVPIGILIQGSEIAPDYFDEEELAAFHNKVRLIASPDRIWSRGGVFRNIARETPLSTPKHRDVFAAIEALVRL